MFKDMVFLWINYFRTFTHLLSFVLDINRFRFWPIRRPDCLIRLCDLRQCADNFFTLLKSMSETLLSVTKACLICHFPIWFVAFDPILFNLDFSYLMNFGLLTTLGPDHQMSIDAHHYFFIKTDQILAQFVFPLFGLDLIRPL